MLDLLKIILSIVVLYFLCRKALKEQERHSIKEELTILKKEFENIWDMPKKSQMENQNLLKSIQINYHGIEAILFKRL